MLKILVVDQIHANNPKNTRKAAKVIAMATAEIAKVEGPISHEDALGSRELRAGAYDVVFCDICAPNIENFVKFLLKLKNPQMEVYGMCHWGAVRARQIYPSLPIRIFSKPLNINFRYLLDGALKKEVVMRGC